MIIVISKVAYTHFKVSLEPIQKLLVKTGDKLIKVYENVQYLVS